MNKIFALLSLSCLFTLAACQDKMSATAPGKQIQASSTEVATTGKPVAPVLIDYQLGKEIQPGVPLIISITLTPMVDTQQLGMAYTLEGALNSGDPQQQFELGPRRAGEHVQQNITVIPQAEGRFHVYISASIENPSGHGGSRSLGIPVVVGNPPPPTLKPQEGMSTDSHGSPIIETPAREEIIRH